MNSIVLNPKVAACEIFYAFSSWITFDGEDSLDRYALCPSVGNDAFYWEIYLYEPNPEGYRGNGIGKKVFSYKFSRDQMAFRSSDLGDHVSFLNEELKRFHSLFMDNEEELLQLFKREQIGLYYDECVSYLKPQSKRVPVTTVKASNETALHFTNFYTSIDLPPMDPKEDDLSEYVLIDLDGWRREFGIGYYNISAKDWFLSGDDNRKIDLEHMRWTHLPINKDKVEDLNQAGASRVV